MAPKRALSTQTNLRLAWALGASLALHATVLLVPGLSLPRSLRVHDPAVTFITAHLEPQAALPEVLKNTITAPPAEAPRAQPPPRAPAPAASRPKPRPAAERLSGQALERTLNRLSETLLYPPEAVRRGLEGEVVLMLGLDGDGRIVDASVASGSGHAILDQAALRAARQLGGLGPSLAGKTILLPVRFRLL